MSDIDNDDALVVPDELTALKTRADLLGVKYHPSISLEKLRDKVNAAVDGYDKEDPKPAAAVEAETENQMRVRLKREANELVRIRVTCMNPNKREWDGEVFTVGNSYVGTFSKYVPFDNEEGWHIPRIIYNHLTQRNCQVFVSSQDARGNTVRKGKMVKEFNIEVMPNLTLDELQELAQRQAMAKSID